MKLDINICVLINVLFNYTVYAEYMNKNKAIELCYSKSDKLLNYTEVTKAETKSLLFNKLGVESSIWIQDYADYSPYISYAGCYNYTSRELKNKHTLTSGSAIFYCLKNCISFQYLGIMSSYCYCIGDDEYSNMRTAIKDHYCDVSRESLFNRTYKTSTNMNVYKIVQEFYVQQIQAERNKGQCVYAELQSGSTIYFTGPCSANNHSNYFICKESRFFKQSGGNMFSVHRNQTGLLRAESQCQMNSSILHGIPIQGDELEPGKIYLTGTFRMYQVIQNPPVCLSVRHSQVDGIVIEPDDCAANKTVLCRNVLYRTTTSTGTTPGHTDTETPTTTDKDIDKTDTSKDKPSSFPVHIIVIIVIVLIIIGAGLGFLYWRYKARNKPLRQHAVLNPEASDAILIPEPTGSQPENEYATPINDNQEVKSQGAIPKKPQRKTLRKPSSQMSYENVVFSGVSEKHETCDDENNYNHINTKHVPPKPCMDYEGHVYSHTNTNEANDENIYNHTVNDTHGADNSFDQNVNSAGTDNIYSHTVNTEDEYDILNNTNKKTLKTEASVTDYSTIQDVTCKKESHTNDV